MIRINLSPSTGRGPGRGLRLPVLRFNLGFVFLAVYATAGAAVGWWYVSRAAEQQRIVTENQRAQRELDTLKATIAQSGTLKAELTDARKRVDVLEALTRDQGRAIRLFDAFVDLVPRDVWLTSLEERENRLKIAGTAYSTTAVADLMSNLRGSGRFKDVDIVVSRQDLSKQPRLVTFEVTCRFEG
jgi:type IV pilus assembly protein PilN